MIEIIGTELNQWDIGRSVKVTDASHVHFANQGDSIAVIMELADSQALIPNYLLQTGKQLCVYAVANGVTIERKIFSVKKRERPENYVYDEDHRNYIYELISEAEEAIDAAKNAVQILREDGPFDIINQAKGSEVAVGDATNHALIGMRIFGKTTQNGVPTPDAPVELVSVGDSGSIAVDVIGDKEGQRMIVSTPNGLPGIPVASGGNYTDADGQQWVCDEIDLARGVYVQRVYKIVPTTATVGGVREGQTVFGSVISSQLLVVGNNVLCSHLSSANASIYSSNQAVGAYVYGENEVRFRLSTTNTADEIAAFIVDNPVVFLLALAAPIEAALSEEELAVYAALHTYRGRTTVSNDAGAWMELEYVMDAKKYLDSLVAAPVPRLALVTIKSSAWEGSDSLYSQVVTIDGVTERSKVDLLPSVEQLAIFHTKDVSFVTENEDGVVTVYAIGVKPTNDYTMQVSITEVAV